MSTRKRKMTEKANKVFNIYNGCTFRDLMRHYRFWKQYIKPIKVCFPSDNELRRRKYFYRQGRKASWEELYNVIGKASMMRDYPFYFDENGNDTFPNVSETFGRDIDVLTNTQ